MGTNFYMLTADKDTAEEWFKGEYRLTDSPKWGYEIHLAKTSGGWVPIFEAHTRIRSINDIKLAMETGKFIIYNEYGKLFSWNEFVLRVVNWNKNNPNACTHINPDRNRPDFNEIYGNRYSDSCFYLSADGYEFTTCEFS